ncbi:unnamed protein product [Owenia fusiformis]|uniref:Senescence domain-containing protein n=1 Tax=Owenia fusiformis TaxID=6347 RepID=A0A8S4N9Y5_OWEFU|nr:unnamed protein product [Owenia fusiformis]
MDEQGNKEQTIVSYTKGLSLIKKALDIDVNHNTLTGDQLDKASRLQTKMTKTRIQIQSRVDDLQCASRSNVETPMEIQSPAYEFPPSYEDSVYDSIMNDETSSNSSVDSFVADAEQLFSIENEVQIYYISAEGYVSAPSYPSSLKICKFRGQNEASREDGRPPGFLNVGEWVYPLIPGTSPVLQAEYGAYIFPDVQSDQPGAAVGLMLPPTLSQSERSRFEQILGSLTDMRTTPSAPVEGVAPSAPVEGVTPSAPAQERPASRQPEPRSRVAPERPARPPTIASADASRLPQRKTSTKIAQGIVTASEWISWGVEKTAEKGGEILKFGSAKLKQHIKPDELKKDVDPNVIKGVEVARQATGVAVKVSGFLVKKVSQAAGYLARQAVPVIRRKGSEMGLISDSKMDNILEVASGGLKGWGTVYLSLETAGKSLLHNITNETVDVVQHKYGSDVGKATEHAMHATGNLLVAGHNISSLGPKGIAKRAVKETGKAVINSGEMEKEETENKKPKQN